MTTIRRGEVDIQQLENKRMQALLEAVQPADSILDVGCIQHDSANASKTDWLHQHLYNITDDVTGLDYLEEDVAELNERGYNVVCADAQDFDLGRTFDTIVAGELIEHLSDLGDFLDCCRRHLQPDGKLVMTTPNPWSFHRFKQALLKDDVYCNPEHTCWLDERTIRQLLGRHGFRAEIEYVRPTTGGVTRVLYDLGQETIGGTSLLVKATPTGDRQPV